MFLNCWIGKTMLLIPISTCRRHASLTKRVWTCCRGQIIVEFLSHTIPRTYGKTFWEILWMLTLMNGSFPVRRLPERRSTPDQTRSITELKSSHLHPHR